jgi:hypothetical protein
MGAMKQLYTASLEYDRETGASLCTWPEWRQRDMRADGWDAELDWADSGYSVTASREHQDKTQFEPFRRCESG